MMYRLYKYSRFHLVKIIDTTITHNGKEWNSFFKKKTENYGLFTLNFIY